jgi:prepilin-type N-terminal cleavage/methylation domain-containing protein
LHREARPERDAGAHNELDKTKMTYNRKNAGFTLIELMIVVAIIAIIASVAIPRLMAARLSANESAAISTLRSLSSAQAQVQSSGAIDCDSDGGGEYGFFGELAGTVPMRVTDGAVPPGAAIGGAGDLLTPSVLSAAFGNVNASIVTRSGYNFQIFLPAPGAAPVAGVAEGLLGGMGAAGDIGPDNAEVLWNCYAWPITVNQTGNRCFFVNQEGDLMQYNNRGPGATYSGAAGPAFDAAYLPAVPADMSQPIAIGAAGNDLNVWVTVQ